jgi:RHS repeat-associated protein
VANTGSGGSSYSYDNNGNMTSRAGQSILWASYNYPTYVATSTENSTFYYGPDRQYFRQDYSGPSISETTYYIGGLLERVVSGGANDWQHYIMAEGQTVAIVSRKSSGTNAVNYILEDNQGSGSTLTNGSGTLLVRESFNAYGTQRDGSDWDGAPSSGDLTTIEGISRRGYTGHSMLGRMGLIHMNGRVEDSITGRFLSPDPNIPDPGFTQSYNRYAYVNNNPMTFIDPNGFTPIDQDPEWIARHLEEVRRIAGILCGGGYGDSPNCGFYEQELGYYENIRDDLQYAAEVASTSQQMRRWGRELQANCRDNLANGGSCNTVLDSLVSGAVRLGGKIRDWLAPQDQTLLAQIPGSFIFTRPPVEVVRPPSPNWGEIMKAEKEFRNNFRPEERTPPEIKLPDIPKFDPEDAGPKWWRLFDAIRQIFDWHKPSGGPPGPVINVCPPWPDVCWA